MPSLIKKIFVIVISLPVFFVANLNYTLEVYGRDVGVGGVIFPAALFAIVPLVLMNITTLGVYVLCILACVNLFIVIWLGANYLNLAVWFYFIIYMAFRMWFQNVNTEDRHKLAIVHIRAVLLIQLIVLIGNVFLHTEYTSLVLDYVKLYNYEQYFAISMALVLALVLGLYSKNKLLVLIAAGLSFSGAVHSKNTTAMILVPFLLVLRYVFDIGKVGGQLRVLYAMFTTTLPIIVPVFIGVFIGGGGFQVAEMELILNGRGAIWVEYFRAFSIENLILPFIYYGKTISVAPHNIFMNYAILVSPVMGLLMYVCLIASIWRIGEIRLRFYVLTVVCFSGVNLELVTHPYFSIQLAFIVVLFSVGKNKKQLAHVIR